MRRFAEVDWPKAGRLIYVAVPEAIVFCAHHIVGATACASENLDEAVALATLTMPMFPDNGDRDNELWRIHWFTAYSRSIGGLTTCAKMLRRGYESVPLLRRAFASEGDYRLGLNAYNLLLSCVEFADYGAANLEKAKERFGDAAVSIDLDSRRRLRSIS